MPGEIRTYPGTEHAGGALSVAPAQNGPGWVVIDRGCDTLSVVANPLPGAMTEAFSSAWRGVDRIIAVSPETGGATPGGIFLFHTNQIWVVTTGNVWSLVHTTTGQTGGNTSPYHSGLYYVLGRTGGAAYVCGLYRAGVGVLGWVKMDVRDGTWTSGTVATPGVPNSLAFAHGIQFEGELAMTVGAGICAFFDPETDNIRTEVYETDPHGQSWKDKLWLAHGRLWVVQKRNSDSRLYVKDRVLGSIWLDVVQLAVDASGGGGWDIWPFLDGATIFVAQYTTTGGTGWRLFRLDLDPTPGTAIAFAERTDPVIPNGAGINFRWPASVNANGNQRFNPSFDFVRDKRGALGGAGATYAELYLEDYGTNAFRDQFAWNGEGASLTVQTDNPCSSGGSQDHRPSFGIHSPRWALGDRSVFPNEPTVEIVEATPYTDGVVARGLLLRLNVHRGSASPFEMDLQLLYDLGDDIGNRSGPPIDFLPQAQGTRVAGDEGGVATLNLTPGAQGNSLDGVVGKINAGILVQHGAVAGGPFEVGQLIASSGTGTGLIRGVRGGTVNRVIIEITGGAFLNGETITQTSGPNTGANATIAADPETDWYHYALIDLDAIGAQEFQWLAICGVTVDPAVGRPVPLGGFTWTGALSMVQVPRFDAAATPTLATSPVHGATAFTSEPPQLATSPVHAPVNITDGAPALATSPVHEAANFTDATPTLATSPVHQPLTQSQNLPPGMVRPNDPQPTVEGGGDVGFQVDGVEVSVREELNLEEPTAPILPGLDLDVDPALPAGPTITMAIDGVVELGRAVIDAVNDMPGAEYELLDMAAAGLSSVSVVGFAWVCDPGDYDGVTTEGQVSIGIAPMFTTMRALADHPVFPDPNAAARAFDEVPGTQSTRLGPADVLGALLGAQATATAARFTLIAYGRVNAYA